MVDNGEDDLLVTSNHLRLEGAPPILVAHRGYSGRYPENTLLAYEAAYQHGARFMELDLQMTADHVPVLHHDVSLARMAGIDVDIRDTQAKHFKAMRASYPARFADEFSDNAFTTFKKYAKWAATVPDVTTFVEIKQESIDRFGIPLFIDQVEHQINKADIATQCVIISFNADVIEYTRKTGSLRTGWVLPAWNDQTEATARRLQPDFVFCDTNLLPTEDEGIWRGNWEWAVYNLDDVPSAINMANRGIRYLETNQIGTLMRHDGLANRRPQTPSTNEGQSN